MKVDALPQVTDGQPLFGDGPGDCGCSLGLSGVGGFGCLSLRGRGCQPSRFSFDGDSQAVGIAVAVA